MRRVYFLVPTAHCAQSVVGELLSLRIEWRHIHCIANHDVLRDGLPEATLVQRSDLLPSLARGTVVGFATGMLLGLILLVFPPAGLPIGGGVVVAITLFGAAFGAWVATMIGVDMPSTRLKRFEDGIEHGELLLMIDVPTDRVHEIEDTIKLHHTDAHLQGEDPTVPAFP
ncbi:MULTISPECIES: DUF1269 domain-containing protein [unclassified Burkholderia]|uniref:DUF1269 domain-containing protein n=1 Tax=unclassified Burkholderia TaxID=2613784 RepID=UPI000F571549|nr:MULTISPECIES: DUF1269 domain-containing protein [unclassified Burkholderia]RQR35376.1 DUF1269 domain-containing protein [Burkholderia sp. Bp9142]RQR48990.1 DUF1269 domain-containing protein [Burkholderia sp. Bp9140]